MRRNLKLKGIDSNHSISISTALAKGPSKRSRKLPSNMNCNFEPLIVWSSYQSNPRSTLFRLVCLAFSVIFVIPIKVCFFLNYPSFPNDKNDKLYYYTVTLAHLPPLRLGTGQLVVTEIKGSQGRKSLSREGIQTY